MLNIRLYLLALADTDLSTSLARVFYLAGRLIIKRSKFRDFAAKLLLLFWGVTFFSSLNDKKKTFVGFSLAEMLFHS